MSKIGICKLTGEEGKFVKCHILPQAFTKPSEKGAPLIQGGTGLKRRRRWTSWYDKQLVTRLGEDVFSELDDWAIKTLRKHRLVWSGFGPANSIEGLCHKLDGVPNALREVNIENSNQLRLFFLSLLWRAAATTLQEFSEIVIPGTDLRQIADILLKKENDIDSFYPVSLVQMSTRGIIHNQSPFIMERSNNEYEQINMPRVFRFYFDGLIVLFPTSENARKNVSAYRGFFVGQSNNIIIPAIPFENSFQYENLMEIARTTDWT